MKILILLLILSVFIFETAVSILNYRNHKALMPESVIDIYDPEKYQTWLRYSMANCELPTTYRSGGFLSIPAYPPVTQ